MAGQQLTGSLGTVMDGLVAGARARRDAAVNALDAVNRQTTAAREQIAGTVVVVPPPTPGDLDRATAERDDRFDPEDWGSTRTQVSGGAAPAVPGPVTRRDEDEDDYPETWLR